MKEAEAHEFYKDPDHLAIAPGPGVPPPQRRVRLSELRSATEIHKQKMRDNPGYRREIERTQAQADAEVEELKHQVTTREHDEFIARPDD